MLLGDNNGIVMAAGRERPSIARHQEMKSYLGRYAGLIIYLKEMDESIYAKLCAVRNIMMLWGGVIESRTQAYFSAISELHSAQMKKMLSIYVNFVKKVPEDVQEYSMHFHPKKWILSNLRQ
jgi:hypothetical protein